MAVSPLRTLRNGRSLLFYVTLFLIPALVLLCGCTGQNTIYIPVEPAAPGGYMVNATAPHCTVFYIIGREEQAGAVIALMEREAVPLYQRYLGIEPSGIPVYLAYEPEDYVARSGYPFDPASVSPGAVSSYNGIVYAYMPAPSTLCSLPPLFLRFGEPWHVVSTLKQPYGYWGKECTIYERGVNDPGIVWAGAWEAVSRYLGPDDIRSLPYFLHEGMAYDIGNRYLAGPSFDPEGRIGGVTHLFSKTADGRPALMSAEMMERRCNWPTSDQNLAAMCQAESVYAIEYIFMSGRYGQETPAAFLAELKKTHDWRAALANVTGDDAELVWKEMTVSVRVRPQPMPVV